MISVRLAQLARSRSDKNDAYWGGPIFASLAALAIEVGGIITIVAMFTS